MTDREQLWRAFLAGFDMSEEGYNGQYVHGCHNMPEPGHVHRAPILEALRAEFDRWADAESV